MSVVYIDVLVIINIYVGYFLIKSCQKLTSIPASRLRIAFGCILSGLFSTIILLELNWLELLAIRLAMATIICTVVFFTGSKKLLLKSICTFLVSSFVFGGIMLALQQLSIGFTFKNGVCYISINTVTLVIYTIVAYAIITIFDYIMKRRTSKSELCNVTVTFNDRDTRLTALIDNGNKLVDIFTGLPIMVCELDTLRNAIPLTMYSYLKSKGSVDQGADITDYHGSIRVIPTRVVSGQSSLMAFKPQQVCIGDNMYKMLVAVTNDRLSDGSFNAIIPNL